MNILEVSLSFDMTDQLKLFVILESTSNCTFSYRSRVFEDDQGHASLTIFSLIRIRTNG